MLQAHEGLYLTNNQHTILSDTQMMDHGVDVNDEAKCHGGLHDIIVDEQEIPLDFKRGLLHVALREYTEKVFQLLSVFDITADGGSQGP